MFFTIGLKIYNKKDSLPCLLYYEGIVHFAEVGSKKNHDFKQH